MRRLKTAVVLCVLAVVLAPSRAYAWFGLLDYLSGPGRFYGELYDLRLACFGPKFTITDELEYAFGSASALTLNAASTLAPSTPERLAIIPIETLRAPWNVFAQAVRNARTRFPVVPLDEIEKFERVVATLEIDDFQTFRSQLAQLSEQGQRVAQGTSVTAFTLSGRVADAMRTGQSFIQQFYRANIAIGSTGVLASLCTPSKTRQFGFEVAADFYQANSDPRYANDHTIRLIIVEPALTYRVFTDPAYDILDVGGGLGAYFFSSLGFQSFNGLVTQIRADIHGPTRWINSGDLAAALSLLTFRVGSTRFPAGFKEGVFGPGSKAIPAEWTPTYALFFDITPFFRRPRDMFGIR